MISETFVEEAEKIADWIIENRRLIHQNPGTGFDIKHTVDFVKEKLKCMGIEPIDCGKAGIVALIGGKKPGKVFLIRADMDALPIEEKADVSFASDNGNMHACGHDMHTAMLLGAARILKQHEQEIAGTVKLMFQPAEEIFQGSKDMIEAGLLENPKVDAALMIHVMAGMPFEPGTIVVSDPGVSAPAADYFHIKVQGKGCHGSMPNTGIDPLNIAAHILINLQEINARELAMNEPSVLTIGTMNAGKAENAIPDIVDMGGSIRTFDESTRNFIKNRLVEMVEGTAATFRGEATVEFGSGCPTLINDKEVAESTYNYLKEVQGAGRLFTVSMLKAGTDDNSSKSAGSEDFAYVSQEVPSIMLALAAGQPDKGYKYPQHHPMVKFDEDALKSGAVAYAYTAYRWLEEHR